MQTQEIESRESEAETAALHFDVQRLTVALCSGIAAVVATWLLVVGHGADSLVVLGGLPEDLPSGWPLLILAIPVSILATTKRSPLLALLIPLLAVAVTTGGFDWIPGAVEELKNAQPKALATIGAILAASGALFKYWNDNRLTRKGIARTLSDEFYRAQGRVAQAIVTGRWWSDGDVREELLDRDGMQRLATAATSGEWRRVCSANGWLETLEGRRKAHLASRKTISKAVDGVLARRPFESIRTREPSDGIRHEDLVELARTYDRLEAARFELRRVAASLPLKLGPLDRWDRAAVAVESYGETPTGRLALAGVLAADPVAVWLHRRLRCRWHAHAIDLKRVSWEVGERGIRLSHLSNVGGLLAGRWLPDLEAGAVDFDKSRVGLDWATLKGRIGDRSILDARADLPGERDLPARRAGKAAVGKKKDAVPAPQPAAL